MTNKHQDAGRKLLLMLPFATYALAYVYLAVYHGRWWLLNVVVHESGVYTLGQTIVYASHFLGHILSLTVIALLFAGAVLTFQTAPHKLRIKTPAIAAALAMFLILAVIISLKMFGAEDTLAYIMQRRQGAGNDVPGGSWNLHLPSTITLFAVLPLYVAMCRKALGLPMALKWSGIPYVALAASLLVIVTALANGGSLAPLGSVWADPRYLAHSVRELATYPLTFFPLPLYFILTRARETPFMITSATRRTLIILMTGLSVTALSLILYQVAIPLSFGIGTLAQKPAFARGGHLSIPYLLSSHYFEHVLDTVYFSLLSLLLVNRRVAMLARGAMTSE